MARAEKRRIDRAVAKIVAEALKEIELPTLKLAAAKSLKEFGERQYAELQRSFSWQLPVLGAILLLNGRRLNGETFHLTRTQRTEAARVLTSSGYKVPEEVYSGSRNMGVPLRRFTDDYFRENVRPTLERLARQFPLDPDGDGSRSSLRNRAEFEVRQAWQEEQIAALKASGVKLVICSTHADCSERCAPYQGRVYSLDGTSGITGDGRAYVPLETATEVYYTTKSGRRWRNGLLGFNCRHFLVPYKSGYVFPKPDEDEERRQYAITQEQRRLERLVRHWRTVAVENQHLDINRYKEARAKAIEYNKQYIAFSKAHDRAYYPSRTRIFEYDGRIIR